VRGNGTAQPGMIQLFNNRTRSAFPAKARSKPWSHGSRSGRTTRPFGIVTIGGAFHRQKSPTSSSRGRIRRRWATSTEPLRSRWTLTAQDSLGLSLSRVNASFLDPRFFARLPPGDRRQLSAPGYGAAGRSAFGRNLHRIARELFPGVDANIRYISRHLSHEFLAAGPVPTRMKHRQHRTLWEVSAQASSGSGSTTLGAFPWLRWRGRGTGPAAFLL